VAAGAHVTHPRAAPCALLHAGLIIIASDNRLFTRITLLFSEWRLGFNYMQTESWGQLNNYPGVSLSVCLSVRPSVCLSVCPLSLSVRQSVWHPGSGADDQ